MGSSFLRVIGRAIAADLSIITAGTATGTGTPTATEITTEIVTEIGAN
jgi:hypothetical protein